MANPYLLTVKPTDFTLLYEGVSESMHTVRLNLTGHKVMDSLLFKGTIMDWLLENANGEWSMGNSGADELIRFEDLSDLASFEIDFPLLGYSPTNDARDI